MSKSAFFVGSLGGVVLLLMIIWIVIALYLAYAKMDVMLEHLKNSRSVMRLSGSRRIGPWGQLMLIGGIAGFVTFPRRYINKGAICAEDIHNFPAPLKRTLVVLHWSGLVLLCLLFLVGGIGKIAGWF
ncbi:hypothetical protein QMK50_17485 [Pseudomonas sp. P5_152]|uniref:hypothetical protein n=1 Tax=Pseudomonas sp. P5_152 TaxID=3043442 RepID=UPI002A364254|nr:hypothetical protein [Pseudomonas sp. P5_152]MDX9666761.1 hypothetical protein [Pseudomonas sp. P5_152]